MKTLKVILFGVLIALASSSAVFADQWVKGYTRSDGTYIQGHWRSSPNQYRYDNFSAKGNANQYTGQRSDQRRELSNPPAYNESYGNPYGNYKHNQ